MQDLPATPPVPRRPPTGCLLALGAAALAALAGGGRVLWRRHAAAQAQERAAEAAFEPATRALREAAATGDPDLDEAARVLCEVDAALATAPTLEAWLTTSASAAWAGLPADLLVARADVLDAVFSLYARQVEPADRAATWALLRQLGPILDPLVLADQQAAGVLALSIPLDASGGRVVLGADGPSREEIQRVVDDWKAQQAGADARLEAFAEREGALLDALERHAAHVGRFLGDWNTLCGLRDRAFLAAGASDWAAAEEAARAAVALAPDEREAHLALGLALTAGGRARPEDPGEPGRLVEAFLAAHPGASAPALVLRALLGEQRGDLEAARRDLAQAAADYPRQAAVLGAPLEAFRARGLTLLGGSSEGRLALDLTQTALFGAAWFSPGLQRARMDFAAGDFDAGRAAVLGHFARRRAEDRWDLGVRDLAYCRQSLAEDYPRILPEAGWLDLEASEAAFGGRLTAAVVNRTDRVLHRATLVLCVQPADAPGGACEPLAPRTEPELPALTATRFEDVEIGGASTGERGVVRAVLVADEGAVFLDSAAVRQERARVLREERMRRRAMAQWSPAMRVQTRASPLIDLCTADLATGAQLATSADPGADDVFVELPASLAPLAPVFALQVDGRAVAPDQDRIEGGRIRLRFLDVADLGAEGPAALLLQADTEPTELVLTWTRGSESAWTFQGVARSD